MRIFATGWHIAVLLVLSLSLQMLVAPVIPTYAQQDAGAMLNIDSPIEGQTFPAGTPVVYTGWAVHPAGPGTGVDRVIVLDGVIDGGDPPPEYRCRRHHGRHSR